MSLSTFLLDAKKAVGVAVATIPAAVAAGFIDNGEAATITAIFGVVATGLTYALRNVKKPAKVDPVDPAPQIIAKDASAKTLNSVADASSTTPTTPPTPPAA